LVEDDFNVPPVPPPLPDTEAAITVDTMVLLGYFKLRASRPELERPFRMPGHPVLPAITILLYIAILVILVSTQPMLALGAGSMLAANASDTSSVTGIGQSVPSASRMLSAALS